MKKITLLFFFTFCTILINAQTNLVVNPSLENWTDGTPDSWTVSVNGTMAQDSTTVYDGSSSAKFVATGTSSLGQMITLTEGKTYTLSFAYYIEAGDGYDARIWSNFMTSDSSQYWSMTLADSLTMKGPGGNTTTAYLSAKETMGVWKTYSISFTVPSNYPILSLQVRTYNKATVYWDKFSLVEDSSAGITNNTGATTNAIYASGKTLFYSDAVDGTVAILYNTVGQQIKILTIESGEASLTGLSKGLYIVKAGTATGKILVK
jgi:hypothetical protein